MAVDPDDEEPDDGDVGDPARGGAPEARGKAAKAKAKKAAKREVEKDYDDGDAGYDEEEEEDGDDDEDEDEDDDDDAEVDTTDELVVKTAQHERLQPVVTPDMIYDGAPSSEDDDDDDSAIASGGDTARDRHVTIPKARERCPYVVETFERQNEGVTNTDFLREKYLHQSVDPNVFYRAGALLFWKDFGAGVWGGGGEENTTSSIDFGDLVLLGDARYEDGTPLSPMSTWTWITGDQHLSNFGAWRNRGGEVVFSVNDFDEAAIYDFHMDVLRIAVSICSHGFTNGLNEEQVGEALEAFTYTYAKAAIGYVGGDGDLVYELNPRTSTGVLRDFLEDVEGSRSRVGQMEKFTEVGDDGARRLIRNDRTRLEDVPPGLEAKIRAEITSTGYGASMMKMGWKVRGWDDDFFTVLDVARRVGSGVGSYGVDRFYVLLRGGVDGMSQEEREEGSSVILDVKYEPKSAISTILEEGDPGVKAWYRARFRNEADRSAKAQVSLTSYTDPYVGYLMIDGNSYNVRERSPYKSSFDYDTLTNARAFNEFMEQIAIATATAHVRGSVAKSPGQFKHVIKLLLAGDRNRRRWSELVAKIAFSYRKQVLLDFECFKQYVEKNFPPDQ